MRRAAAILGLVLAFPLGLACAESPPTFELGVKAMLEGNFAEAYCQWKPLAHKGYAEAQYHLGWLYANGNGLRVDMQKAFYWWKAAAHQGHADAQFALGFAYMTGEGVKQDLDAAARWFLQAAKKGHIDARDSLMRLAGDSHVDILSSLPELAQEPWFGWSGQVTGDRINVRAAPATTEPIVAKLEKGQVVRVLGRHGKWLRVQLPKTADNKDDPPRLAWVYHSLLKSVGPHPAPL